MMADMVSPARGPINIEIQLRRMRRCWRLGVSVTLSSLDIGIEPSDRRSQSSARAVGVSMVSPAPGDGPSGRYPDPDLISSGEAPILIN